MPNAKLRVSFDANVLIAGARLPRWPFEVMRSAFTGAFDLVLAEQVIIEARRHAGDPQQSSVIEAFLASGVHEELPMPTANHVRENADLVRSERDVPIALALLDGEVDIFVTNDRDFTDPGATADRFRRRVRIMLVAPFLKDVLGWSSEALEEIRNRSWSDLA
ncbi:MAG: hypothetical protein ABIP58_01680 [Dehalococcoidia bacterium]